MIELFYPNKKRIIEIINSKIKLENFYDFILEQDSIYFLDICKKIMKNLK